VGGGSQRWTIQYGELWWLPYLTLMRSTPYAYFPRHFFTLELQILVCLHGWWLLHCCVLRWTPKEGGGSGKGYGLYFSGPANILLFTHTQPIAHRSHRAKSTQHCPLLCPTPHRSRSTQCHTPFGQILKFSHQDVLRVHHLYLSLCGLYCSWIVFYSSNKR
jgi:hypothetical protein